MTGLRRTATRLLALTTLGVCACPQLARACAVCYGETDSPMARGLVWGILVLLVVLLLVLAGVAWFFVHMGRRAASGVRHGEAVVESNLRG
ncbi:MAG: hypothetical protein N3I86_04915 [Verrucomicrobiae bacterium]|nr:hypothetical protein [Verrucomicrobiae bacterium]MDW8309823.1 hypothetical protein [Verrucomicrobiales bacterium]